MVGVLVSAGTPKALVARLNADIAHILAQPDVRKRLSEIGFDPVGNSPPDFSSYLKAELDKWAKVIKE
jgi:tripartite-type tricarboxylate transporter receptor subunit TctC